MEEQRTYLLNEKSKLEDQLTGNNHNCNYYNNNYHYNYNINTNDVIEYKHKVTILQDSINHLESSNSTISSSYGQKLQTIRTQFQSTTNMLEQVI